MSRWLPVVLLLTPRVSTAAVVPAERAGNVAQLMFPMLTAATRVQYGMLTMRASAACSPAEPEYYIFENTSGGFIIIAGDDTVPPVLAYGSEGRFDADNMPEHVAAWMGWLRDGIAARRAAGARPSADVSAQWRAAESGTTRAGTSKLYTTASWNQSAPYNGKLPDWDGKGSWAGCVPVAMAIIMRYHKHPAKGHRTLPDYEYVDANSQTRHISGYELGHEYDWDNMPLSTATAWTAHQTEQVQQFILDCAVMCQASISSVTSSGTSASTVSALTSMKRYMRYDSRSEYVTRNSYSSDEEWLAILKENLDNYGPLMYSGGGHCYVVDGYDSAGRFHLNLGWGGTYNGYYTYPDFYTFKDSHHTSLHLCPDMSDIRDKTLMRFEAATRILTFETEPEAEWRLTGSDGRSITDCVTFSSDGVLKIDTSALPAGDYVLRLTIDDIDTDLKIKL